MDRLWARLAREHRVAHIGRRQLPRLGLHDGAVDLLEFILREVGCECGHRRMVDRREHARWNIRVNGVEELRMDWGRKGSERSSSPEPKLANAMLGPKFATNHRGLGQSWKRYLSNDMKRSAWYLVSS